LTPWLYSDIQKQMKHRRERGNSIVEFSLLMPWLIFLFIGAMDWGFYADALISTESAARVACEFTSSSSATVTNSTTACTYALGQLAKMPNVGTAMSTCASGTAVSSASPVGISTTSVTGPDGNAAAQVSVTYLTPVFLPMMGNLPSQVTITRTVQMRVL
jgi:Flp pilus assembly protein TadG